MFEESPSYLLRKFVFELERAADDLLQAHVGISYNRALFLFVLQQKGTITQHELAVALGYSDPAVSSMLLELVEDGYITTAPSPEHRRKRLVTITPEGSRIVTEGWKMLQAHFNQLMEIAEIDPQHFSELTMRLYNALLIKKEQT
ncbi:MAG TPA: MarR family transcriptional regulator [Ktedonobacteraceae bacterium]|nr:MarR family transcriptional regulator [Ktedonobacteraceae bacterium]